MTAEMNDASSSRSNTALHDNDDDAWIEIDPVTGCLRCPWCGETGELDFHFVNDDDRYQMRADTAHPGTALFEQEPVPVYCHLCDNEWAVPPHCRLASREPSGGPGRDSTA